MRLTIAATLMGLSLAVAAPAEDYSADTIVAKVGDSEITLGHMIMLRSQLPEQYDQLDETTLFNGILDQLVDQATITESAGEVSKKEQLNADIQLWSRRSNAVIDGVVATVTDEEIQAAYDAKFAGFEGTPEFNASHILVETEEEALDLIEKLSGGADFATLAAEFSTGPSGPRGGELGWFGQGAMVPPFEAAVVALEVGAVSAPVQTQFGWHVVKLNDARETAPPTLADSRDALLEELSRSRIEARLATIRAGAEVDRPEHGIPASAISQFDLID